MSNVGHRARRIGLRPLGLLAGCLVLGFGSPTLGQGTVPTDAEIAQRLRELEAFGERAVVAPSKDAIMGFSLPTSVHQVYVSGGQPVTVGDPLVRGNDAEAVAEAKFQRARADTKLPTDRSKAQLDLAQAEYDRQLEAFDRGAANPLELDRTEAAWTTAKIDYELSLLNEVLSDLQATQAEERVARLTLRAPFDGVVDIVHVSLGQSISDGEPVIRVVSVDPLWIDVDAPTSQTIALSLQVDSKAWVVLQDDVADRVYTARVIEVAPTADGTSGRRRVRVEMDNALGLLPGVNCWVRFTPPEGRWESRVVDPGQALGQALGQGLGQGLGQDLGQGLGGASREASVDASSEARTETETLAEAGR